MIRLAEERDAEQLLRLNEQFNGAGETTLERVRESLRHNRREIVAVADEGGVLAGFVSAQIKRSFCYTNDYAEISELFVSEGFRRRGLANALMDFIEQHCLKNYPLHSFELMTGRDNAEAQALYRSRGYFTNDEMLFRKRL